MKSLKQSFEIKDVFCYISLLLFSVVVFIYMTVFNFEPSGMDTWGHVYKAHYMLDSLSKGNIYPLYDTFWYNGSEVFRYWGPGFYYLYCIPLFLAGGNIAIGYRLYVSMMFFFSGLPWVIIGNRTNKRITGTLFGMLWFMLPNNLFVLITQGNLPQATAIAYTPYVFLFLRAFLQERKNKAAFGLVAIMSMMSVTHLLITAITGISSFLLLLIDGFYNKDWWRKFCALAFMVLGIGIMAVWVYPALIGGIINTDDAGSSTGDIFANSLALSLNPVYRFTASEVRFYFGLSFVLLSVFGLFASNKKNKAGFIFFLILVPLSTPEAFNILSKISGMFWMERFTPFAYGAFLISFFEWSSIRKKFASIMALIIMLDVVPFYCMNVGAFIIKDEEKEVMERFESMVDNRATVLDCSSYDAYPAFYIPFAGSEYSFGWAWQGSLTMDNTVLINEALENGRYLYSFDRCVELGDDTVLVRDRYVPAYLEASLIASAQEAGYRFVERYQDAYIFKLNDIPANGKFGVISNYDSIAIGKYSPVMTTLYPSFCVGKSNELDEYTFEELSQYECIFLTGFECNDFEYCENLIQSLSDAGVRVVVDAAHLPIDPSTRQESFMGVDSSFVKFEHSFPTLTYRGRDYYSAYPISDEGFNTRYIVDIDNPIGVFNVSDKKLIFAGTMDSAPNVYFVGANLMYFVSESDDSQIAGLMNDLLLSDPNELPQREIVPIDYTLSRDTLTITTDSDNVNSCLAWTDSFEVIGDSEVRTFFNLMEVDHGTTVIKIHYPYLKAGVLMSSFSFVMTFIAYALFLKINRKYFDEKIYLR